MLNTGLYRHFPQQEFFKESLFVMIFRERNLTTLNDNYKTKKKKKTKGDIFEQLKGATDFPNIFQTFQIFLL